MYYLVVCKNKQTMEFSFHSLRVAKQAFLYAAKQRRAGLLGNTYIGLVTEDNLLVLEY